jgi:HK97 family phage portal protein
MGILSNIMQRLSGGSPQAATQSRDGGVLITNSQQLDEYLRAGAETPSGQAVSPNTSLRVAAVFACIRIIAGTTATLPFDLHRRVSDKEREDASDHPLWEILKFRPNGWQTASEFRRQLTANVLMRGNGFCLKVVSRGKLLELLPLPAERVEIVQHRDLSLTYKYRTLDGDVREFAQKEIFHLRGLTLDGVRGVAPLTYARNTIGLALAQEDHGATAFKNGARVGGVITHPNAIGEKAIENLKASVEAYRSGGEREGKILVLEEAGEYKNMGMSFEDAQWIESRKFSRSEIAMFFGVPPHMIGDTEKTTSWGSGIEQQAIGFVTYTLEDYLTMWEQSVGRDLIERGQNRLVYAKFNRAALARGDLKSRVDAYSKFAQWGLMNPNEIRALEDMNPRPGGDEFYDPPNTAGGETEKPETEANPGGSDEREENT